MKAYFLLEEACKFLTRTEAEDVLFSQVPEKKNSHEDLIIVLKKEPQLQNLSLMLLLKITISSNIKVLIKAKLI